MYLQIVLSNFLLSPLERMNRDLAGLLLGEAILMPKKPLNPAPVAIQTRFEHLVGTYGAFMPIPVSMERERLFITIFGFKLELFPQTETPGLDFIPLSSV
ncbi:hypothetical protein AB6A23_24955 [Paenibacillus tarimensis]